MRAGLAVAVIVMVSAALLAAPATAAEAEGAGGSTEALAQAAQNPVANLISLPFQFNFNFAVGTEDRTQTVLNIQPVIPVQLNPEWNLITRTIVPVIWQPEIAPGTESATGLGDTTLSLFLSPAEPKGLIWGAGPALLFPTATDEVLGTGQWGAGPSFVGLKVQGHWVYGALINNIWSFTGQSDRPSVNLMTLQPFVNYNYPTGWYLTSAPILTANWEGESGQKWTVPVGAGVGRIFTVGKQPVNASLAGYYNVEHPDLAANWQLRFQVQLLFPG
jgi:hypothetical protein